MSAALIDLILSGLPEDGSSIGNGAMLALLREVLPDLTQEDYNQAKNALIAEGVVKKGASRGGSISLIRDAVGEEHRGVSDPDDFELLPTEEPENRPKKITSKKKKITRKSDEPTQVLSYRHKDTRVNNPEMSMVHADTVGI